MGYDDRKIKEKFEAPTGLSDISFKTLKKPITIERYQKPEDDDDAMEHYEKDIYIKNFIKVKIMSTVLVDKLFEAIENQEVELVIEMIKGGINPNTRKDGLTVFQKALYTWDSDFTKQLIPLGVNIYDKTDTGKTALHIAAELDSRYILEDIEELNTIDIEAKDDSGKTAFNLAAACGSILLINTLQERGADINTSDNKGKTPLMNILEHVNSKKIKSWESEGTNDDENARYEIVNGWMRCINPYYGNPTDLGEVVSEYDQVDIAYEDWAPEELEPYQEAISYARTIMKFEGLDFKHKDIKGNTAVHYACIAGEIWLLRDMVGETSHLYDRKYTDFNFNEPNADSVYPLHFLAQTERWDALDWYFKHFSEVNNVDNNGWSAGHYLANKGGHHAMAKLLVKKGLDLSLESTKSVGKFPAGTKAFEIAKQHLDNDMANILEA